MQELPEYKDFLLCETPVVWIDAALQHPDIMLIDHANCEKKAASTAMLLINKCAGKSDILLMMSRLAREELRHFEQVLAIMKKRKISYGTLSSSRYARSLHEYVSKREPERLVDTLIVGAFIEARSCERFSAIAPHLDAELSKFYLSLLKSESRHFHDYLQLAIKYSPVDITDRVAFFADKERELILSPDHEFRFHSGAFTAAQA